MTGSYIFVSSGYGDLIDQVRVVASPSDQFVMDDVTIVPVPAQGLTLFAAIAFVVARYRRREFAHRVI
jgi:hypothetical protein